MHKSTEQSVYRMSQSTQNPIVDVWNILIFSYHLVMPHEDASTVCVKGMLYKQKSTDENETWRLKPSVMEQICITVTVLDVVFIKAMAFHWVVPKVAQQYHIFSLEESPCTQRVNRTILNEDVILRLFLLLAKGVNWLFKDNQNNVCMNR